MPRSKQKQSLSILATICHRQIHHQLNGNHTRTVEYTAFTPRIPACSYIYISRLWAISKTHATSLIDLLWCGCYTLVVIGDLHVSVSKYFFSNIYQSDFARVNTITCRNVDDRPRCVWFPTMSLVVIAWSKVSIAQCCLGFTVLCPGWPALARPTHLMAHARFTIVVTVCGKTQNTKSTPHTHTQL